MKQKKKANILRSIRLDTGLSQEQVAKLAGVSQAFVSKAEKDDIRISTLFKFANAIGCEITFKNTRGQLK